MSSVENFNTPVFHISAGSRAWAYGESVEVISTMDFLFLITDIFVVECERHILYGLSLFDGNDLIAETRFCDHFANRVPLTLPIQMNWRKSRIQVRLMASKESLSAKILLYGMKEQ